MSATFLLGWDGPRSGSFDSTRVLGEVGFTEEAIVYNDRDEGVGPEDRLSYSFGSQTSGAANEFWLFRRISGYILRICGQSAAPIPA